MKERGRGEEITAHLGQKAARPQVLAFPDYLSVLRHDDLQLNLE